MNILLVLIAVAVLVILLGLPFYFYGKKENSEVVPYEGECLRETKLCELKMLQDLAKDLFSGTVVNEGDRKCITEVIDGWYFGESFYNLMNNLVEEAGMLPSMDFFQLENKIKLTQENLHEISRMRHLEPNMKINIRASRIALDTLLDLLKKK